MSVSFGPNEDGRDEIKRVVSRLNVRLLLKMARNGIFSGRDHGVDGPIVVETCIVRNGTAQKKTRYAQQGYRESSIRSD